MGFRDAVKAAAEQPLPSKVIPTQFGEVKIEAPSVATVDAFRKALGDKAAEVMGTQGALIAMCCRDAVTGAPIFTAGDIEFLSKLPATTAAPFAEAIGELVDGHSLDPTTPATGTSSD
jgi:hypothetical protein